jgi:hypothetical protein
VQRSSRAELRDGRWRDQECIPQGSVHRRRRSNPIAMDHLELAARLEYEALGKIAG